MELERQRLRQTVLLAMRQLEQARLDGERSSAEIAALQEEMRDNASHSVSNLWDSQNFEDMVALSQYTFQIEQKASACESVERRAAMLEKLIDSPYFARIDFKFDDEELHEKIYIGRSSLWDDELDEIFVYDWRAPIASMFYRFGAGPAFYDAPAGKVTGEISLKRQYEIKDGKLDYFFDADIQIIDEFLKKLLSQNTSPKMKTIVETIQKEQDIVIRDMENELMMVQGVAGSGKSSIALHRAAYLMYQGLLPGLAPGNIIIISPNTLFAEYISGVLPELGEENVVSKVFEEILAGIVQTKRIQTRNQFLELMCTNLRYKFIMKSSIEFKASPQFVEILDRFVQDLPRRWIDFDDVYYGSQLVFSKEHLNNKMLAGRKNTPLGLRLNLLEDYILESVKVFHRHHADKQEYSRIKKDIKKFTELDTLSLYIELFGDEEYFRSLAVGLALPDCLNSVLQFTCENLASGAIYYDDAAALAYLRLKLKADDEYKNIRQVVIDEAQDYYPLHYEIFRMLFPGAKYTVLGDVSQTLEKPADLSLYGQIGAILSKKKKTLVTMSKSYRCTNEILAFSSKFIPAGVEIESFSRKGSVPEIHVAENQQGLCTMIAQEAESCLKQGYQSIGLICKTEKNATALFKSLKGHLGVRLVKNEGHANLRGVFVIPVYLSKGLEFDAVLICDADSANYSSEDDKKFLYVACTRALHRLNLFCAGEASPLVI
ncbi:MAG: AAA family ATPase [Clostridiales bacterium]|nr:AAA family ATPase [Clostridiales bacterium]